MKIPDDPQGYSVSQAGTIHTRYAEHGDGTRTRTKQGALNLLGDRKGRVCRTCYPPTKNSTPSTE